MMGVGPFAGECSQLIFDIAARAREQLVGQRVLILVGKYTHRWGEVMDIIPDATKGIRVLVHPVRMDGHGFLTDHPQARKYWGIDEIGWDKEESVDDDTIV